VRIAGQVVRYTATAGWLIMKDDAGKPVARFGYTAYHARRYRRPRAPTGHVRFQRRPGLVVDWLHMGILGAAPRGRERFRLHRRPPRRSASTTSSACST